MIGPGKTVVFPEPFMLIFESTVDGQFDTAPAFAPGVVTATGVIFQSTAALWAAGGGPPIPVQQVKIKFLPAPPVPHPEAGYKYDVQMGGKKLDPRLRPRG